MPFALGGAHILERASCRDCAKMTSRFETAVLRGMWGDAREAFNAPSRHKKRRKGYIEMPDPDDPSLVRQIPSAQHPGPMVFYRISRAGILIGAPVTLDTSASWELVVIDDNLRLKALEKLYPGKLTFKFRHSPYEFGRMIAKIGYCQVLTSLTPNDFHPFCLPYIMGTKHNVSYIVGGSTDAQQANDKSGYDLSTFAFGTIDHLYLLASVRLLSNTHAPQYHVVVGDVIGRDAVVAVTEKIGPASVEVTKFGASANPEHWQPLVWPL